jgi:hypothetical protein
MTTITNRLVKLDSRGRVLIPDAQREAPLDSYESSGLSGPKFCAMHGVKYPTFATWMQRRRRERGELPERVSRTTHDALALMLAEVELPSPRPEHSGASETTGLVIRLPGGTQLHIKNQEHALWAAAFVNAVAGGASC